MTGCRSFATQRGYAYVDYYTAMVDPARQFQAELSDDGLHPNAKGYRVMAPLAAAAIDKTLLRRRLRRNLRSVDLRLFLSRR